MARRRARELAFRTLFQAERGSTPVLDVWRQVREELAEEIEEEADDPYGDALDREGIGFAERLVTAYAEHAAEVDARLEAAVEGWTFGQMNQTDLNVLRLATTEMLYEEEIPGKVTIEMAVRTAKKFGGEESGRFVNGVLARLYRDLGADRKGS
ncbi:MAG TPA: transcription antitermination factor NusB [Trueperaceae bacterium]